MGKNISVYIRNDYSDTFKKFKELIKKDPDLIPLQYRNRKKIELASIGMLQLVTRYVVDKTKEIDADKETSEEFVENGN